MRTDRGSTEDQDSMAGPDFTVYRTPMRRGLGYVRSRHVWRLRGLAGSTRWAADSMVADSLVATAAEWDANLNL